MSALYQEKWLPVQVRVLHTFTNYKILENKLSNTATSVWISQFNNALWGSRLHIDQLPAWNEFNLSAGWIGPSISSQPSLTVGRRNGLDAGNQSSAFSWQNDWANNGPEQM